MSEYSPESNHSTDEVYHNPELHPVFQDAIEVQDMLNQQTYTDYQEMTKDTLGLVHQLDTTASEAGLFGKKVAIIGPNDAILRPYLNFMPLNNLVQIQNAAGEERNDIPTGEFSGFTIQPKIIENHQDSEEAEFSAQLYYHVHAAAMVMPHTVNHVFYTAEVNRTNLIFEPSYPQVAADDPEELTDETVKYTRTFNHMLDEIGDFPDYNPKALKRAAEDAFHLLNKSPFAEEEDFEDILIDAFSSKFMTNKRYNIAVDYALVGGNLSGKGIDFEFVIPDNGRVVLPNMSIEAVSCLPRTYLAPHDKNDGVVRRDQKTLYLTSFDEDRIYHIPLEHLREIESVEE